MLDVEDSVDFVVVISAGTEGTLVIVLVSLDLSVVATDAVIIITTLMMSMTLRCKLIPKPFVSKCLKLWMKTC